MSFGEDFGQKVDLTASIRNILRNYPEGTAVLKELVQNADDAGARTIVFTLDCRQHGTAAVAGAEMGQFQGPALLAFNDAVFTAEDFKSIQRIGDSLKKTAEDKGKIGRFGIGFNAVYHWTDLPSFVSSNYLVMLDPQARFLPNVNPSNPGKMVDWISNPSLVSSLSDQFAPYSLDWSRPFAGTLFRLPLRTAVQAETSTLSKRALSVEEASALLEALRAEASAMLLFLKSVEVIEIKRWDVGAPAAVSIFRCAIANVTQEMQAKRAFVGGAIIQGTKGGAAEQVADFSLRIACQRGDVGEGDEAHASFSYEERWEVCNQLGGLGPNAIASDPANALLRLVPWGGLAACISDDESSSSSASNSLRGGLAYCFLPLPVQTGLPVMVNGFFELSSNRRDVWQAGVDMTGDGRTRAEWNLSLMRDVIGPSYVRLLLRLRSLLGFSATFQKMFPSSKVPAPWNQVVNATLQASRTQRLVRVVGLSTSPAPTVAAASSGVGGGGGGGGGGVLSDTLDVASSAGMFIMGAFFSSAGGAGAGGGGVGGGGEDVDPQWIECNRAVLLPESRLHGLTIEGEANQLSEFLIDAKQPLVLCLPELRDTLQESGTCVHVATPELVRQVLRNTSTLQINRGKAPLPDQEYRSSSRMCTFLVRYCLSDMRQDTIAKLDMLPFLPLSNDNVSRLRIYSSQHAQAVTSVCSMGFSVSQAIWALSRCGFDVERACDSLTAAAAQEAPSGGGGATNHDGIVIISDEEEQEVFSGAAGILLDKSKIGPKEKDFLVDAKMQQFSNIRPFQASLTPDLLRHILPKQCFDGSSIPKGAVPDQAFEPMCTFLRTFWKYASYRPDVILAVAQGASIVPSQGFESFYPLSRISNLIVPLKGDVQLPANVLAVLVKLGIRVVEPSVMPDNAAMPKAFWDYVNSPSRSGIVSALEILMRGVVAGSSSTPFDVLASTERDELRLHLATSEPVKNLTEAEKTIIRSLPLFTNFNNSVAANYISIDSSRASKNGGGGGGAKGSLVTVSDIARISVVLFPNHFLQHNSAQDLQLLQALGVRALKRSEYFRLEMLPNIESLYASHPEETDQTVLEMLVELGALVSDDKDIINHLRDTAFLPSGSRRLSRPGELFDPHELELAALLDQTFFPAPAFQRDDILVFLRSVGLQQTLDWSGVLACARFIASMDEATPEKIEEKLQRGRCLLRFLNKNISSLLGEDKKKEEPQQNTFARAFRSLFGEKKEEQTPALPIDQYVAQLASIPWVPSPITSSLLCIPWPEGTLSCAASALSTRPLSDAWLCSASKRIVVDPVSSPSLQRVLGWNEQIDVRVIAVQLKAQSRKFLALHESYSSSQRNGDVVGGEGSSGAADLQSARETVTGLIPQLYQRLNSSSNAVTAELLSILQGESWIWVGETFVESSKIALTVSVNASPYLYQLPQDLRVYSRLLEMFRVKNVFSPRDYIDVLRRMAEECGTDMDSAASVTPAAAGGSVSAETSTRPLSDANVDLACNLVTLLSTEGSIAGTAQKQIVYIPDNSGRLGLATDLVNDDVPWLSGPEYISIRVGCRLIHPNISSLVAGKMGVKSLRLTLVNRNVEQNLFAGTGEQATVEAFGQAESLTSRLKTILDMYPDGNPIFSELIQNADDTGASIVRIMLDENSYGTESLLDIKMAPLQGPSLIVSNDAVFTEADFRSLARIGQGSKLEKMATTGRFGLGFNSTYHLTDTPTFVSGEYLVIFDPHCTFCPGATTNQPGLRIRCHGNSLKSTFRHQFEPFEYFGCDFQSSFKGTLFRFPLRNSALARKSEISSRSYTVTDVDANLSQLIGQLSHHLLFLRSVRNIEIYHCAVGNRSPSLLHRASSSISNVSPLNDQKLLRYFDKNPTVKVPLSRDQFYAELLATSDDKLPKTTHNIRVVVDSFSGRASIISGSSIGGGGGGSSSREIVAASASSSGGESPEASSREEVEYMVVIGLEGGEAKKMACDPKMRHLKLIPMGGVAACISRQCSMPASPAQQDGVYPTITGQAFCFLPLPVQTRLPVHINAYWELSSNRRDIWRGEDTKGEARLRSEWNMHVMRDVLAPLYATLIMKASSLQSEAAATSRYKALSLLPCPLPAEPWNTLGLSLFPLLRDSKLLWSNSSGGKYISLKDALLLGSSSIFPQGGVVSSALEEEEGARARLEALLLTEALQIALVPMPVLKPLIESGCVAGEVTPELVRRHFSNARVRHPAVEDSSNAIFLLQYCFRDVNKSTYGSLQHLPLLPLESGALGTFLGSLDEPIFTVNEPERRLMQKAGGHIVASDAILGPVVSACLKDPAFAEVLNVRPMTPLDLLGLLRIFIPQIWFAEEALLVDRTSLLSNEWLAGLWSYILEGQTLSIFEKTIPMLPVLQPANQEPGSYVAKISPTVPVLHMNYKDMPAAAAGAFADLGIYIFDPSVLGGLSYSVEIGKLLYPPSFRGVLDALLSVSDRVRSVSKGGSQSRWSAQTCKALQDFVLDEIVVKADVLTAQDVSILCSLPIWLRNSPNKGIDPSELYSPIATEGADQNQQGAFHLQLPPIGVEADLLGEVYLKIRGDRDRALYKLLGVQEPSKGHFFATYIIPQVESGGLDDQQTDDLIVEMLRSMSQLENEYPGLTELVSNSRLIRNSGGVLSYPKQLFDPQSPHLPSLLPKELFPSAIVFRDFSLLVPLRALGLNTTINCDGVLKAAQAIQADLDKSPRPSYAAALSSSLVSDVAETESAVRLKSAIKRAEGLLKYMELNIEVLLEEADPKGLASFQMTPPEGEAGGGGGGESSGEGGGGSKQDAERQLLGAAWSQELRALQWIPVYTEPPVKNPVGLPWPKPIHTSPLAAPSQCLQKKDVWLCSSTNRISTIIITSELLRELLGWNTPISGRNAALQLLTFKESFDNVTSVNKERIEDIYGVWAPKLLGCLQVAYKSEGAAEVGHWMKAISKKAIIWVRGKFVDYNQIAFKSLSGINTEPFLFTVTGELAEYGEFLKALGVRDSFGALDLVGIMREVAFQHRDAPLGASKLQMCVGVLKLLVRLMNNEGVAVASADEVEGTSMGGGGGEEEASTEKASTAKPVSARPALTIEDLGPIYLPDRENILTPSMALSYDDAPWISAALVQKDSGIKFVTQELSLDDAMALGARSLREQLFAGDEVVCPDASALKSALNDDSVHEALTDLLSLSDQLGAHTIHALYDMRTHPSESLMHPGLSDVQGPALVVCIEGITLSSEEIIRALNVSTATIIPPLLPQGAEDPQKEIKQYPTSGKRLISTFAVTDCLQIVSGREFFIFDPRGTHLLAMDQSGGGGSSGGGGGGDVQRQAAEKALKQLRVVPGKNQNKNAAGGNSDSGAQRNAYARAQRCFLVGSRKSSTTAEGDQSILSRFPDQFEPFMSLPFGLREKLEREKNFKGVLIRMPLRAMASSISSSTPSTEEVKIALRAFKRMLEGSLVLGNNLLSGMTMHVLEDSSEAMTDTEVYLLSSPQLRSSRRDLLREKGWKKTNVLNSLFGKAFVPPEVQYTVNLSTKIHTPGWLHQSMPSSSMGAAGGGRNGGDAGWCAGLTQSLDNWIVMSTQGAGRIKDVAVSEPYRSFKLPPCVTIAAKVLLPGELSDVAAPADVGMYYCSGGPVGISGLPFLIEGPFLQDIVDRNVPTTGGAAGGSGTSFVSSPQRRTSFSISHGAGDQKLHAVAIQNWNATLISTTLELLVPKLLLELSAGELSRDGPRSEQRTTVEGFYKNWPFYSRMTTDTAQIASRCRVLHSLASQPLFVSRAHFLPLENVILPTQKCPSEVIFYLQTMLPVAQVPIQLARDLSEAQIKYTPLTPTRLRESLKRDAQAQSGQLRGRYELILPLLDYCISDITKPESDGEFLRRKAFRELAGVPLLPMADGSIRAFPASTRERVAFAPVALHALLPGLVCTFTHPTVLANQTLFNDPIFKDTLFIGSFSASFLQEVMPCILPEDWRRCQAIKWIPEARGAASSSSLSLAAMVGGGSKSAPSAAGRGLRPVDSPSGPPSELLLYVLWKDVLNAETATGFDGLKDWPIVPVISKGRRLLLSAEFLHLLFCVEPTSTQDSQRAHLAREAGRYSSIVLTDAAKMTRKMAELTDGSAWDWLSQRPANGKVKLPRNVAEPPVATALRADETATEEGEQAVLVGEASVSAADGDYEGGGGGGEFSDDVPAVAAALAEVVQPEVPRGGGLSAPPAALLAVMERLGVPVLDGGIFAGPPRIFEQKASEHLGKRLLECLYALSQQPIVVYSSQEGVDADARVVDDGSLLNFDDFSRADRAEILLEIYRGHRTTPFLPSDIQKLKVLRLFTAQSGEPVAIADCPGVYWCANDSVLDGISLVPIPQVASSSRGGGGGSAGGAGGAGGAGLVSSEGPPVILVNDPNLSEIYALVGVVELTASTAVRRFTLPALDQMNPTERLKAVTGLASRWNTYKADAELVNTLKAIAFIPTWDSSIEAASVIGPHTEPSSSLLRRANELFSSVNIDLLEATQGPQQSRYFAPPWLRTPSLLEMCHALGMLQEVNKEGFLTLARDIETVAREDLGDGVAKQEACDRGRRLLRYIKEGDRSVTLFDKDLCNKLSKIAFVPMQVPVVVETGGYVVLRYEIGRFCELLSKNYGALGFSVIPILEDDIAPEMSVYSWLGILSSPSLELVLRHLYGLTSNGEAHSLDRWNSSHYTVQSTFGAIFQFLMDHWNQVPPHEKAMLRGMNIVPTDSHLLIKPARLFFRLSVDLSPFMHEVSRYFGAHEVLLKELGVKETPSAADYCRFLCDLALECKGFALNPNELRAVVTIIQSISEDLQKDEVDGGGGRGGGGGGRAKGNTFFLPDEDSILRDASFCLLNDDPWLRERAGDSISRTAGLFMLHPSISLSVASVVRIPRLSRVLVERLVSDAYVPPSAPGEEQLQAMIGQVLGKREVVDAVAALVAKASNMPFSSASEDFSGSEQIASRLRLLRLRFVSELQTKLVLTSTSGSERDVFVGGPGESGTSQALSFVKQDVELFVNVSLVEEPITIEIAVALGLCKRLHIDPSLAAAIACLLHKNLTNTNAVLSLMQVGGDKASVREKQRGMPGERLTKSDAQLLELKPFRIFRQGEIVAVPIEDEGGSAALLLPVPPPQEGGGGGGLKVPASSTAAHIMLDKLRYAKIIQTGSVEEADAASLAHMGVRRCLLRLGTDTISKLSTDIYSFKSARDAASAAGGAAGGEVSGAWSPNRGLHTQPAQSRPSPSSSRGEEGGGGGGSGKAMPPQPPSGAEPVSRGDVLGALQGLLLRAGVPLSMDQQSMLTSIVDLQMQSKVLTSSLQQEREQLLEMQQTLATKTALFRCKICENDDISHLLNPCGHTLCEACVNRLSSNKCPFCNTRFAGKLKLHIG